MKVLPNSLQVMQSAVGTEADRSAGHVPGAEAAPLGPRDGHRGPVRHRLDLVFVIRDVPALLVVGRHGKAVLPVQQPVRHLFYKPPSRFVSAQGGMAIVTVVYGMHFVDGVEVADDESSAEGFAGFDWPAGAL